MLSKRKPKNSAKNLSAALSGNRSTRQSVRIHGLVRDPPRFLKTVSCLALWILQQPPCCICHPWLLPMLPSNTKNSLDTLKGCGKRLGYQSLNAPPFFDGGNYAFWKVRMRAFLCVIDESVWDFVKNGYVKPTTTKFE